MATAPIRRAPVRPASRTAPRPSSGYRGAEGLRKMKEEEELSAVRREAARSGTLMPFRFFCPVGETREVIIVDEQPDFFRFEHGLKDRRSGKWNVFTACINEDANCPVCAVAERPAYFAMYLTVIDLTPYETEKAGYVEWSKKLLVIKSMQQKKFARLYEREGTLRGMRISLTRDSEKDAGIGNDIEFIEFVPEEELQTYITEFETERDGKKEIVEVLGYESYDYDALFPLPSERELQAIVGGGGGRGGDDRDDARDRRGDYERRPTSTRTAARAPERPASRAPAARPALRAPARPPARGRYQDDAPPEDAEYTEGDGEAAADEAPPPRRATASRAAPPTRATPPSRSTLRSPPPREEVEDPPQRASLAARRQQLRRP